MDATRQKIVRLIYTHMIGESSAQEEAELQNWLQADVRNQIFFEEMLHSEDFYETYRQYKCINKKAAYKKFTRKTQRRSFERTALKYVAIFILPLVMAVFFLWQHDFFDEIIATNKTSIHPGGTKATLKLADGRIVELLSQDSSGVIKSGTDTRIMKTDSGIVYINDCTLITETNFNELSVPRGGEYRLTLSDGTKVYLNSQTFLRYPETFQKGRREVFLIGEAFFEVANDPDRPFYVETNDIEVKVLGTSFNINTRNCEQIQTTLVTGSIELRVLSDGEKVLLKPNQMAEFNSYTHQLELKNVFTYNYTAWRFGEFAFDKAPLDEIMEQISMWYVTEISYENEYLKKKRFTGIVNRFADVIDVLSLLEGTTSVKFKIQGDTIIVQDNIQ